MNIHPEDFINLKTDALIGWKDVDSRFLGCNDAFAQAIGALSSKDVAGKFDHELSYTKHESDGFRDADCLVMRRQTAFQFKDRLTFVDKQTHLDLLTLKCPLLNDDVTVLGVFFMGHLSENAKAPTHLIFNSLSSRTIQAKKLTSRQITILELIVLGKSAKEIGRLLYLSPRTIEMHLINLKQKFNARTKSELIEAVISEFLMVK